jgi:uncharacterized membrane protein YkgB
VNISEIDAKVLDFTKRHFVFLARLALFVIFFWFGLLKIIDLSPAGDLAYAMVGKTIGLQNFNMAYIILGCFECLVGILMLVPRATLIALPLLLIHMIVVVAGPIVLLPGLIWQSFAVPTLEGQYIIKNVAVLALAIGIASNQKPLLASIRKIDVKK